MVRHSDRGTSLIQARDATLIQCLFLPNLLAAAFTDVTSAAGVGDSGDGRGVAWGDFDGDGDLDLYVANYDRANVLYRKDGDSIFTDVTSAAGVGDSGHGSGAAWGDFDGDGDLDLYV